MNRNMMQPINPLARLIHAPRFAIRKTPGWIALCAVLAAPGVSATQFDLYGDSFFLFDSVDNGGGTDADCRSDWGGALCRGTVRYRTGGTYIASLPSGVGHGAYFLTVAGQPFQAAKGKLVPSPSGKTVRYPATNTGTGLTAWRNFYVPNTDSAAAADYGRYVDCIQNTTTQPLRDISVRMAGFFGFSPRVTYQGTALGGIAWNVITGDHTFTGSPNYVGNVIGSGTTFQLSSPSFGVPNWSFTVPILAPKATACFLTYVIQATNARDAQILTEQLATTPDVQGIDFGLMGFIRNFNLVEYAKVTILPSTGNAVDTASFDANIFLVGTSKALTKGVVEIKLNRVDISSRCSAQQNLMAVGSTTKVAGRGIHCPALSDQLVAPGVNTFDVTHTSASGGKTTAQAVWTLHSAKPVPAGQ